MSGYGSVYICICNAVTSSDIAGAIHAGASSLADLCATLGVASCCGKCRDKAEECLNRHAPEPQKLMRCA